ncbi:MAG: hemerythrin domain-containing protein [Lautropia sp.]
MTHKALQIIRAEHGALSAMLHALRALCPKEGVSPTAADFELMRAILFYIDEFPERLHHTKESELLFPMVRRRAPESAAMLDRLDAEHARGESAIRDLQHDLLAWEQMGTPRRDRFASELKRYADFYAGHLQLEETAVLPLAARVLDADDWSLLDAAFELNRDPLTGHEPSDEYRSLFTRILNLAPAPIGLGDARPRQAPR